MGKRRVRTVVVPKGVSIALLILVTAGIVALIYALSGRAYASEAHSTRDLVVRLISSRGGEGLTRNRALTTLMPVIANMLPFIPWGFFAFIVLDTPERRRLRTYALTVVVCLVFVASTEVWQEFLPTRVTTLSDSVASAAGALTGAIFGHLRKRVRVAFEV